MQWLIMGGGLNATATNLGYHEETSYVITEECKDVLDVMVNNILQESKVKCQARRNVANSRLIQMDLIPILCHSTEDPEVFDAIVRLLMHLSMPLEVVMPILKKLTKEDYEKRDELQKMLATIKKEFTQSTVISCLVGQMALIIEEAGSYAIDQTNADTLSNCLTLIRNVLYVNYERYKVGSLKNDTIIGKLFKADFQDVLKEMCRRPEGSKWLSSLLQVLHLMYKDTSSLKMMSYLNRKHEQKLREAEGAKDEQTTKEETKVVTDAEGPASPSLSTHSLETIQEPLSPGPSCKPRDTSSCERTLSCSSTLTIDSSGDSTVQEGDSSQSSCSSSSSMSSDDDSEKVGNNYLKRKNMKKLAQFGLDYIKYGMDNILIQCKEDLKNMVTNHYFLWQMNFFIPFATHPDVSYTDIKLTLSAPVFSQLLSSTLMTWEAYVQASNQRNNDSKSNSDFKILNMQASTMRQMLHAIQQFTTNPQNTDIIHMKTILATIALTDAVRNFYYLLIRKFQPNQHTLSFLRELIVGNDLVLRIIDQVQHIHRPQWGKLDMTKHIGKFATRPIMRVYNYMLSKFSLNTLEENEVVMTMMHHVVVDIAKPEVLYQIPILSTFASLWEAGSGYVTKQSHELIDYIIHEFCVLGSANKEKCLETVTMPDRVRPAKRKHVTDVISKNKMMKMSSTAKGLYVPRDESDVEEEELETSSASSKSAKPIQDLSVEECLAALRLKGFGDEIAELQNVLLEICYFKLNCPKVHVGEPHIWHCVSDGKSVPIIPFTESSENAHADTHFKALLHRLGLHTAQDTCRLYPSVPAFWPSDMCYKTASMLGDILEGNLKFELDQIEKVPVECEEKSGMTQEGVMVNLEDLDLGKEAMEKPTVNRPYFQVPLQMWCNVIKRANKV
ncbi:protein timeless [Strongylocentrotus purpuratus]|uniref:Timeless n=1 Tax=Strongylocentrotus purpuratus TaxID=7668 RepID=A0A7M7HM57_STRPU|nr:protein timeless [Strongylocentrotus purpuratus]XP_791927.4 protein timeless [Strongylocentrotus purpuratus]